MCHSILQISNGRFDIRFENDNSSILGLEDVPSYLYLVVGEDGHSIVVDTGFSKNHIPGSNPSFQRHESEEVEHALAVHGIHGESIRQVILTHLHWDHTGGMHHFPNATFFVQAGEFQGLTTLKPNEETYYAPGHFIPFLPNMALVNGEYSVKPGVKLILTGSHTLGHQVVEVETKNGKVYLAGDAPFSYNDLWKIVPKTFWDAYRKGPTKRFYWSDQVKETIQNFIRNNNIDNLTIPKPTPLGDLRKSGNPFITTHSSGRIP